MSELTVLHLLNDVEDFGNGINNSTVDLACAQAAQGLAVHVASAGGGHRALLEESGVTHHLLDQRRRPANLVRLLARYRRLLAQVAPDVVHAHNLTGSALSVRWPARRYRTVATLHLEDKRGVRLTALSDAVVVFSDQAARQMRRLGARPDRVHVVRQGVLGGARAGRQHHRPVAVERPAVVTVAGLYEHKGVYDLLEAFARVLAEVPGAHLYLVGDGPERARLQAGVEAQGLADHVHLVGFSSDVASWLQAADVFTLPSRREPAGLVLMEARAAGRPIVATAVDGIPTLVAHERSALLVPPARPVELAGALVRLLQDDGLRRRLADGTQEGLDDLGIDRFATDLRAVYASVLPC